MYSMTNPNNLTFELPPVEQYPLPEGYSFSTVDTITPIEFRDLYNLSEMGSKVTEIYLGHRAEQLAEMGYSHIDIGVRKDDGELVGFGSVAYDERMIGQLDGLIVHPDHQSKGIGKALVIKRMTEAEKLGVVSYHMYGLDDDPAILPTNSMKSFYFELGFTELENGELIRGSQPDPVAIEQ